MPGVACNASSIMRWHAWWVKPQLIQNVELSATFYFMLDKIREKIFTKPKGNKKNTKYNDIFWYKSGDSVTCDHFNAERKGSTIL